MFLKQSTSNVRRRVAQISTYRLQCEHLESRLAPAIHTWTGTASNLWSDAANWDGGSPADDPEAELVFPRTAANLLNTNDLSGLTLQAITFSGGAAGYRISGEALALGSGGITVISPSMGNNTLSCDLLLSADVTFVGDTSTSRQLILDGVIQGDHAVTVRGVVHSRGANTYTGGTIIRGTALTGNPSAFGTGEIDLGGTIYGFQNGSPLANPYRVSRPGGTITGDFPVTMLGPGFVPKGSTLYIGSASTVSLRGGLSGEGSLSKRGVGNSPLILGGTNTYSGTTTIEAGSIRLESATGLPEGTAVMIRANGSRPRLDLNGFDVNLGSLTGAGEVDLVLGSATLTTGGDGTSTSFSGVISGSGGVVKVGAGAWTLSGNSTFTGGLIVADGAVRLTGSHAAGAGALDVIGGTLEVAANMDVAGPVTNYATVVIEPSGALQTSSYEQPAGATYLDGGTLAATEGITIAEGSILGGYGVIDASVTNAGILDVGFTGMAGYLYISGDYTQAATGSLHLELGDLTSGNFDSLDIAGLATLAGSLDVELLADFVATEGDGFRLFNAAGVKGSFDGYNLPDLGDEFLLDPVFDEVGLTLWTRRR